MDYARAVVEFFVDRRGKGSAISSADEHLLYEWECAGVPVSVVVAGIDAAFERKSEAPKSLSDCKRWVTRAYKLWVGGAPLEASAHRGVSASAPDTSTGAPERKPGEEADAWDVRFVASLERRVLHARPELRAATDTVVAELRLIIDRGALTADVVAVVDEAIAESALALLTDDERRHVTNVAELPLRGRSMSGGAWIQARSREVLRLLGASEA